MKQLFLAFIAFLSPLTYAAYVFTTVDYPGSTFTDIRGINNTGQIAGYTSVGGPTFGFIYDRGAFTPLPPPPAGFKESAVAINDAGVIVGSLTVLDGSTTYAYYLTGSTYTVIPRPGWAWTEGRGINNAGLITGYSINFDASGIISAGVGFIFNPATGATTEITVPNSRLVIAHGINTAGQVVGSGQRRTVPGGNLAFLRDPATGINSYFQVNGRPTRARGINDFGVIAGFIDEASGFTRSFVGTSAGFELLDVPGAINTFAEWINNSGQISGLFDDAAGHFHGFIGTPAALPTGTTADGAFTFTVDVIANVPIYIDPVVALGYEYETGMGDPRFATVRMPIGIGDNHFTLLVNGRRFAVTGGELFDFRTNGFSRGVSKFRVTDIEETAGLEPGNPLAFPTQLTFMADGRFTGTMTPLCLDHPLPPQASKALAHVVQRCKP